MNDKVKCEICGKTMKEITHTHLKKHDVKLNEYIEKYPEAKLVSDTTQKLRDENKINSLEYWTKRYGYDIGVKKYQEYKDFLSYKNTYDYKKKKYGWSKEDFEKYNKSRAVTLENMIKKHGEDLGKEKYESYCNLQSYVGTSEQYFIDTLGRTEGKKRYQEINRKKSHSLDTYIERYGCEVVARKKLRDFYNNLEKSRSTDGFVGKSIIEVEFCQLLMENLILNGLIQSHDEVHSSVTSGTQYRIFTEDLSNHTLFLYDIVIPNLKICIEFNGDYWHCNPKKYDANYYNQSLRMKAKDKWKLDEIKINYIEKYRGYNTKVVWEADFLENKNNTVDEIVKWIKQSRNTR